MCERSDEWIMHLTQVISQHANGDEGMKHGFFRAHSYTKVSETRYSDTSRMTNTYLYSEVLGSIDVRVQVLHILRTLAQVASALDAACLHDIRRRVWLKPSLEPRRSLKKPQSDIGLFAEFRQRRTVRTETLDYISLTLTAPGF